MGDIAEMIMMGFLCQKCGAYIDRDAWGFPRNCDCCEIEENRKIIPIKKKHKKREKQQG